MPKSKRFTKRVAHKSLGKKHLSKKHLGKKSRRRNVNSKKKTLRKKRKLRGGAEQGDNCPICQEGLVAEAGEQQERLVRAHPSPANLPPDQFDEASHVFHEDCLRQAIRSGHRGCPTCRTPNTRPLQEVPVSALYRPGEQPAPDAGQGPDGGAGAVAVPSAGTATAALAVPGDSARDEVVPMDWDVSEARPAHLVPVIGNEVAQYPVQLQAALSHPDQRGLFDISVAGAVVEQHNALGGPHHLAGLTGVDANPHLAGGGYVRQAFIQRQLERGAEVQNPPAYARRMEIMRYSEDRRLGAIPENIRHQLLHITETALQHYNADTPYAAIDITVNALTALHNAGLDLTNIQDEARFIQDYTNFVQTMINHLNLGIAHTPEQAAQTAFTELRGS
jgi:hypothetical protein